MRVAVGFREKRDGNLPTHPARIGDTIENTDRFLSLQKACFLHRGESRFPGLRGLMRRGSIREFLTEDREDREDRIEKALNEGEQGSPFVPKNRERLRD